MIFSENLQIHSLLENLHIKMFLEFPGTRNSLIYFFFEENAN